MNRVDLRILLKDRYTYPSRIKGKEYPIYTQLINKKMINVYYDVTCGIKRRIQGTFPRYIYLSPGFCWALGFFKGEGVNSIINGSYRRFSIINRNPKYIKKFLDEIINSGLLEKSRLEQRCFQIHHYANVISKTRKYWAKELKIPEERIIMVNDKKSLKKNENGVCRFDISNVLLRKIIDLLNEKILKNNV